MSKSNENSARPRRYTIRRRRRSASSFPNYALEQTLNTGLEKVKTVQQMRDRMRRIVEDDKLWARITRVLETEKEQQANYDSVRKHMESVYRGVRKGRG